jgi:hypothetical protein
MKAQPKHGLFLLCSIALTAMYCSVGDLQAQQSSARVESRVQQILSQMTLEEKLDYIGGGYPSSPDINSGVFNIKAIRGSACPGSRWSTGRSVSKPFRVRPLPGIPRD